MKPTRDRTDQKLRFARIALGALAGRNPMTEADWFECHVESAAFHVFGVFDMLLQELNEKLGLHLPLDRVTLKRLLEHRPDSRELQILKSLVDDEDGWLGEVQRMRNRVAHRTATQVMTVLQGGTAAVLERFTYDTDRKATDAGGAKTPLGHRILSGGPEDRLTDALSMMELLVADCRQ